MKISQAGSSKGSREKRKTSKNEKKNSGDAATLLTRREFAEMASLALLLPHQSARSAPSPRVAFNAASVPDWLQTGKFRSARWDGGPIEADKGRLSGWPNYSADDPRQVLQATRDWYNPKTIEFLKIAHINWAWVTWSVGFSPATERKQWEILTRYIKACRESDIHVAAYISVDNMFWREMFEHLPQCIAWVRRNDHDGPLFYSRPNRYMADISKPDWIDLQKKRVEGAVRAGAEALWIDNTFAYDGLEDVARFLNALHGVAAAINPSFVVMSNYNHGIYTWARLQNGVTTEDGKEPGWYTDKPSPYRVTNAGLLRYNYGIGEGWRPVSMEDGGRHNGNRLTTPMQSRKWQLAIAECAMHHVSLEPFFEGLFLRDLYFREPPALEKLRAIGVYNHFLERNEPYYTGPESLARIAILSDRTDAVVPYLNQLSNHNLNYDVIFNYQSPRRARLRRYKVIVLPNTNPLSTDWCSALSAWVREDGGTLVSVQDASLFSPGPATANQDFGLKSLLGISKQNVPLSKIVRPRGNGTAIFLPLPIPAGSMVSLIRRYLKESELVEVEPRETLLSNVAYQPERHRIVVHLLNYRQNLEKDIRVQLRAPVERAEILSPDHLSETTPSVRMRGKNWEIAVPQLQTYNLLAIYLKGKGEAGQEHR